MKSVTRLLAVGVGAALLLLGVVSAPVNSASGASATLRDPAGRSAGSVRFAAAGDSRVVVQAVLTGATSLTPGFHGFHIHATGSCVAPSFTSAGAHLGHPGGQVHDDHAGDMPSLLVKADHSALLTFETDRALLDQVLDSDGAAVIVHAGADNFANIPPRYGTPDATTLATGDAGSRALCGELR
ncbi:MAG: superoxide dismutase family protein [Actinomycetota bacterium]|nr:superoxide dismutase family protein [Actinomycetota bacterium]